MPHADPDERRRYGREWKAARRAEFFADKTCVKCGSTYQLELDHIDPALKVDHKIWSWSRERQAIELVKCQVLCGPHHKGKTIESQLSREHGRNKMYDLGCRCPECSEAKRVKNAKRYVPD